MMPTASRTRWLPPRALSACSVVALLLAFTTPSALRAEELAGRAQAGYQVLDAPQFRSETFNQLYELRLSRELSPVIRYLLAGRASDVRGDSWIGELRQPVLTQELAPIAELTWQPSPFLHTQLGYTLIWTRTPLVPDLRQLERKYARIGYHPEGLPGLALQAEDRRSRTTRLGPLEDELSLYGALDLQWRGVTAVASSRYSDFEQGNARYRRQTFQESASLGYQGSFLDQRLDLSANVLGGWTRLIEGTTAESAVSAPKVALIQQAYLVIDDTPLDNTDRPLVAERTLIDGDAVSPTPVSLGPDAPFFQNVAIDVGRVMAVDELRFWVRRVDGALVEQAGDVSWSVYYSLDLIHWFAVDLAAQTTFNPDLSRYEVTFPSTTSRYFKFVSTGVNLQPIAVTEIEAYYHEELSPTAPRISTHLLGNASLSAVARPMKEITLSYLGSFNLFRQLTAEAPTATSLDYDQTLALSGDPFRFLNVSLRYQERRVQQTTGFSQLLDVGEINLTWSFIDSLRTLMGVLAQYEDNQGKLSTTRGLKLQNYAFLYRNLRLSLDTGYLRQVWLTEALAVDKVYGTALLEAQVTQALRLTGQAAIQRNRFEGTPEDVPLLPGRDERYLVEANLRASQQLMVTARLGWAAGDQISGLVQRYRLDWYPFPEGSIRVGFNYDQDIDPYLHRQVRRLAVLPHWSINRNAALDLNYTLTMTDMPVPSRTSILFLSFTLTL